MRTKWEGSKLIKMKIPAHVLKKILLGKNMIRTSEILLIQPFNFVILGFWKLLSLLFRVTVIIVRSSNVKNKKFKKSRHC